MMEELKVYCLGTNGYFATEHAFTACYMTPKLGIIFDLGSGFFRSLDLVETPKIHVFLSHAHVDHICSMNMLQCLWVHKVKKIFIHAEPEILEGVKKLLEPPIGSGVEQFTYVPIGSEPIHLYSGAIISSFNLKHTTSTLGFRLDYNGHSMAYVTDTHSDANSTYIENLRGVNLLLHECYYPLEKDEISESKGHSSPLGLGNLCKATGITNVVIIHHNPFGSDGVLPGLQQIIPTARKAEDNSIFSF